MDGVENLVDCSFVALAVTFLRAVDRPCALTPCAGILVWNAFNLNEVANIRSMCGRMCGSLGRDVNFVWHHLGMRVRVLRVRVHVRMYACT